MERKIKVVIIEFLPVIADILRTTLDEINKVEVVGLANDYNSGNAIINQHRPDFLVFDYNPHIIESMEVITNYRVIYPEMRIIVITSFDITEHISYLIDLQVSGVINKASTINQLGAALECALNNQFIVPIPYLSKLLSTKERKNDYVSLTARDINIMKMVMEDKTREEIASYISVSKRSIDNYLRLIYKKLGCSNRMEAVGIFARSNIV